jgi:hypothetical protein
MSIDQIIEMQIDEKVKERVAETLEPMTMLRGFEDVDVLTFDETARLLRLAPDELENAIKTDSVPCIKPGKLRSTWRFPKRLLVEYLLCIWKPKEKKEKVRIPNNDISAMAGKLIG